MDIHSQTTSQLSHNVGDVQRAQENIDAPGEPTRTDTANTAVSDNCIPGASRNMDPAMRIAEAIEKTLLAVGETSMSDTESRFSSRLSSSRILPEFHGDPLEWLHFRDVYKVSSELNRYTDRENIARLVKALK